MRILIALLAFLIAAPAVAPALAQVTDQTLLIGKAANTVERLRTDTNLGPKLANALQRARAVFIVPDLVKGGFLLGAEYGTGILMTRERGQGRWSGPAFYSVAGGSIGLQIGLQDQASVFVILTDGGLAAVMNDRMKLGAEAGVAVATIGAAAEASTTTNLGADIVIFAKSAGVYGGATIDGAAILPRHSWNAAFYGGNPVPEAILLRHELDTPMADRLRDSLTR